MSLRRRTRKRREGAKANIDMNSLIDLTFLLLVVFIVTLPTLEQTIPILLPVSKEIKAQNDKKNVYTITVDMHGKIFVGEKPVTIDDLKADLLAKVAADPQLSVVVRGDERAIYGDVFSVIEVVKVCNVRSMGLACEKK